MDNPYKILQIDTSASSEVIKAAYRALMKSLENHPDLGGDVHYAQKINAAYAKLSNLKEKQLIDEQLRKKEPLTTQQLIAVCLRCGSFNQFLHAGEIALSSCGSCGAAFSSANRASEISKNKPPKARQQAASGETDPFEVAVFLYEHRLYQRAIDHLQPMIEQDADNPDLNYLLGMCYYRQRRLREANRVFLKNLLKNSEHYLTRLYLGKSLMQMRMPAVALSHLRIAARLRPKNLKPLMLLGNCLFANTKYLEATKVFKTVSELDNLNLMAHYLWGVSYFKAGFFDQALEVFQAGVKKFPTSNRFVRMIRTTKNFAAPRA